MSISRIWPYLTLLHLHQPLNLPPASQWISYSCKSLLQESSLWQGIRSIHMSTKSYEDNGNYSRYMSYNKIPSLQNRANILEDVCAHSPWHTEFVQTADNHALESRSTPSIVYGSRRAKISSNRLSGSMLHMLSITSLCLPHTCPHITSPSSKSVSTVAQTCWYFLSWIDETSTTGPCDGCKNCWCGWKYDVAFRFSMVGIVTCGVILNFAYIFASTILFCVYVNALIRVLEVRPGR